WFAALPQPRLLYLGSLAPYRFDLEVMLGLARRMPSASIALVGPGGDNEALRPLVELPNVHVRSNASRDEVIGLAFGPDVGLIPNRRTALTECMSPLKLYEYLAAGRPV